LLHQRHIKRQTKYFSCHPYFASPETKKYKQNCFLCHPNIPNFLLKKKDNQSNFLYTPFFFLCRLEMGPIVTFCIIQILICQRQKGNESNLMCRPSQIIASPGEKRTKVTFCVTLIFQIFLSWRNEDNKVTFCASLILLLWKTENDANSNFLCLPNFPSLETKKENQNNFV